MKYFSAIWRNRLPKPATTWLNLMSIVLSERSQTQVYMLYHSLYRKFWKRQKYRVRKQGQSHCLWMEDWPARRKRQNKIIFQLKLKLLYLYESGVKFFQASMKNSKLFELEAQQVEWKGKNQRGNPGNTKRYTEEVNPADRGRCTITVTHPDILLIL